MTKHGPKPEGQEVDSSLVSTSRQWLEQKHILYYVVAMYYKTPGGEFLTYPNVSSGPNPVHFIRFSLASQPSLNFHIGADPSGSVKNWEVRCYISPPVWGRGGGRYIAIIRRGQPGRGGQTRMRWNPSNCCAELSVSWFFVGTHGNREINPSPSKEATGKVISARLPKHLEVKAGP